MRLTSFYMYLVYCISRTRCYLVGIRFILMAHSTSVLLFVISGSNGEINGKTHFRTQNITQKMLTNQMTTKPLSKTLLEAIEHNNDGVLLIECGCYQEARESLQIALKQTRTVVHAMKENGIIPRQTRNTRF